MCDFVHLQKMRTKLELLRKECALLRRVVNDESAKPGVKIEARHRHSFVVREMRDLIEQLTVVARAI